MIFSFQKLNLLICYSGPILAVLPIYFGVNIVKLTDSPVSEAETKGYWALNEFGNTTLFKSYAVMALLFEYLTPLPMLITLNILTVIKFKKVMANKIEVVGRSSETQRAEKAMIRFTRLIITLTFINIVTRTLDSCITVFFRFKIFFNVKISDEVDAILDLARYVSLIPFFGAHALDGVLYYIYDKNMRSLFSRIVPREEGTA